MKKLIVPCLMLALASCQPPASETPATVRSETNKAMCQRFYDEVFNAHNPAMLDSFVTADVIDHQADPSRPEGVRGIDSLRASFVDFFSGFPDVHSRVNYMIASGDTVVVHFTMTGTNSGPMAGMPPTNRQVNVDGVDIILIRDGKCTEHWGYMEEVKMFMQLGLMPEPGAAPDSTAVRDKAAAAG